jgi:tetratricopeptide (TPR) repeat protein
MRLSAFEGTFDLTAAQAVAGASPRVLASLVEKSLLRSEERSRYAAHSLLRRFAFEKMIEHGGEDVRVRFIDYYLLWAERIAGTMNVAPNGAQKDSTHLIESEHENLLSAMEYALEGGLKDKLLRLSWALTDFWLARGHFAEARHWTQNALELHGDAKDDLRARAYYTAAYAAWRQGDLQVARNLAQEALEIELSGETPTAQAAEVYNLLGHINAHLGDRETARALYEKALIIAREIPNGKVAAILNNLGLVASDLCDFFTAQRYFEEAVGLLRDSGDQSKMATVLLNLGVVAVQQNDLDLATKYYEEALEIVQALKIVPNIAVALCNLGEVAHKQGDFPKASKLYSESVGLLYQLGDKLSTTIVLEAIGRLAAAQHQPERAAVLLGLSEAWRETLGAPMSPRDRADYDIDVTRIHRELSSGRFAELWAQGRHMSLEEGIVLVAQ